MAAARVVQTPSEFRYRDRMSDRPLHVLRKRLLGALCALLCLALLAGCQQEEPAGEDDEGTSLGVSRDPILLPDDAREIVEDLNAGSDKANETIDDKLQNSIETSPARDIDDAFFKRLKALGRTSAPGAARQLQDVTVYVPKQTAYPARFMAYVKLALVDNPGEPPTVRLRLYEKEEADEPWKLAMYITVPPEFPEPDVPLDADGFAELVSPDEADEYKLDPFRVPEELSSYLSAYAAGTDSSIFAPGRFTNELAQSYKATVDKDAALQITTSVEVQPGELDVQAFKTRDGGALALFSTDAVTRYAAAPGKSLSPTTGSEGLLPTGTYDTIDRRVTHMNAAVIPPAGAEGPVQVVGSTSGVVAFEHSP